MHRASTNGAGCCHHPRSVQGENDHSPWQGIHSENCIVQRLEMLAARKHTHPRDGTSRVSAVGCIQRSRLATAADTRYGLQTINSVVFKHCGQNVLPHRLVAVFSHHVPLCLSSPTVPVTHWAQTTRGATRTAKKFIKFGIYSARVRIAGRAACKGFPCHEVQHICFLMHHGRCSAPSFTSHKCCNNQQFVLSSETPCMSPFPYPLRCCAEGGLTPHSPSCVLATHR